MFCSRQTNNMINKIHERALRIVLNDHFSDFETMVLNMNDTTINHRHIQTLMIENFEIKYDLAPSIMDSLLNRSTICYNFRNLQEFQSERKRTMFYGFVLRTSSIVNVVISPILKHFFFMKIFYTTKTYEAHKQLLLRYFYTPKRI